MFTAGGDYSAAPKTKPMCGCTDHSHQEVRDAITRAEPADHRRRHAVPGVAHAQRLRHLPPGAQLLPDLDLAAARPGRSADRASSTSAATPTSRRTAPIRWSRACGAARPRRASCARIADVVDKYNDPDGQGHRRPAHRPARREEGGPAGGLGRPEEAGMPSGHAYAKALRTVKTCVGSEWCRFGTQDSTGMGKDSRRACGAHVRAAQGQARGVAAARATAPRRASRTSA